MNARVSVRRWVVCSGVGMCIGFLYFAGTLLLAHREWYHKIGEGSAPSQWLDAIDMVLGEFPFGYWIRDGSLSYFLNGLLWATLGGCLSALLIWRRQHAQLGASPNGGPAESPDNSGLSGGPPSVS